MSISINSQQTISKGSKSAILFVWTNTAINKGPAIVMCGRKEITVGINSDTLTVGSDISDSLCVLIDSSTGDIIVKNNTSSGRHVGYHIFLCE